MSFTASGNHRATGLWTVQTGFKTRASAERWAKSSLALGWQVATTNGSCCG